MKAQSAAMEYLVTYVWVILIVVIVAAALFAPGIFNPQVYDFEEASFCKEQGYNFTSGFSCWKFEGNNYIEKQVICIEGRCGFRE